MREEHVGVSFRPTRYGRRTIALMKPFGDLGPYPASR
jgi:hypothetical protein